MGKSQTEDIGRTAPPGSDVPVGRLDQQISSSLRRSRDWNEGQATGFCNHADSQDPFGDGMVGVVFDPISIRDYRVLQPRQFIDQDFPDHTYRYWLLDGDCEWMHGFTCSNTVGQLFSFLRRHGFAVVSQCRLRYLTLRKWVIAGRRGCSGFNARGGAICMTAVDRHG